MYFYIICTKADKSAGLVSPFSYYNVFNALIITSFLTTCQIKCILHKVDFQFFVSTADISQTFEKMCPV